MFAVSHKPFRYKKSIIFIVFSLLVHFFQGFFFNKSLRYHPSIEQQPTLQVISLKNTSAQKQIADIQKPIKEEKPDKAKAEAMYSQKVKEEMVNNKPPQKQAAPVAKPQQQVQKKVVQEKPQEKKPEAIAVKPQEQKKPESVAPKMPGIPQETYSMEAPSDSMTDYKVGDKTYINTDANLDIQYYVELKRKFRLTWNPVPPLRAHRDQLSGNSIHVVLGVTVGSDGTLKNVIVIEKSGIDDYDRECIRTVRSSAPFSAPPSKLLQSDNELNMAWTFVVSF